MASPPFDINQALPGDSDIVSQHPTNARAFRDIVESWLLIDHNNLGQHAKLTMPWGTTPASPAAGLTVLYINDEGHISAIDSIRGAYHVGLPPASIVYSASSTLEIGFLRPDGSAVSRTAFTRLFARLGTLYGPGDGSTTFNLPNLKGRIIAGYDAAGSLITTANGGLDTTTLGAVGGAPNATLLANQIPSLTSVNAAQAISVASGGLFYGGGTNVSDPGTGGVGSHPTGGAFVSVTASGNNSISVAYTNASQQIVKTVPPAIVLQPMIKY